MADKAGYQDFEGYCEYAARRFMSTVLAIDDEPIDQQIRREGTSRQLRDGHNRPSSGLSSAKSKKDKPDPKLAKDPTTDAKLPAHRPENGLDAKSSLDAETLVLGLADRGIMCSVFAPKGDSPQNINDHVERANKLASCSDAIILDWDLKGAGGSHTARKIIKLIVSPDQGMRLVIIYTKERSIGRILEDIKAELCEGVAPILDTDELVVDKENATISIAGTRISALNKPGTLHPEVDGIVVAERELPERIIREFAALSQGLLPSIALHSIAAVRESTFHLLATLSSEFDPAIIAHRCLLPNPEDAEDFCLDLISDEMRSAMSVRSVGRSFASAKDFIERAKVLSNDDTFGFQNIGENFHFTLEEMEKSVNEGSSGSKDAVAKSLARWQKKFSESGKKPNFGAKNKILESLLGGNEVEALSINMKFSRLAGLKREAYGTRFLPEGWRPTLILGSIIKDEVSNELLLCVQPRCDCVRLKGPRSFPFLALTSERPAGHNFVAIALRANPDESASLHYVAPVPHQQILIPFKPTEDGRVVAKDKVFVDCPKGGAAKEKAKNQKDSASRRYLWIADLKDIRAQQVVSILAGRQGSVGIDEYEWLRQQSKLSG